MQQCHRADVGKVEIYVAIVVVIAGGQAHAEEPRVGPGLFRHFCETPALAAEAVVAPEFVADGVDEFIVDEVNIEVAIVVVIGEVGDKSRPIQAATKIIRNIAEGAIPVVVVELIRVAFHLAAAFGVARPVGDVEIKETVVVEITPGGGFAVSRIADTGGLAHLYKLAACVAKQGIGPPVGNEEVAPAVVVVIYEGCAVAVSAGQGYLIGQG